MHVLGATEVQLLQAQGGALQPGLCPGQLHQELRCLDVHVSLQSATCYMGITPCIAECCVCMYRVHQKYSFFRQSSVPCSSASVLAWSLTQLSCLCVHVSLQRLSAVFQQHRHSLQTQERALQASFVSWLAASIAEQPLCAYGLQTGVNMALCAAHLFV